VNLSVATYDGKVIAGQLGFVLNSRTYIHMYNCRSDEHKQLNAVNRLIDEEIRWAKKHGLDFFDLGTSVESHTWNAGLVKFKESFGATGQFRTRYTKTL
jgi:lipid II:glycine glycyltransferase (peptidoglycan interpeptide bridge formation enzyme)